MVAMWHPTLHGGFTLKRLKDWAKKLLPWLRAGMRILRYYADACMSPRTLSELLTSVLLWW